MVDHRDRPSPGEQADPHSTLGEFPAPLQDSGEAIETPGRDAPAQPHPARPAAPDDSEYARDSVDRDRKRRTSTERDGFPVVKLDDPDAERQRDHSPGGQRETAFDPAQDNAGPLSDKN